MPNIENIRKVIDAIRTGDGHPEIGFNMGKFYPTHTRDRSGRDCGTAMCIGGWAYTLATGEPMSPEWNTPEVTAARNWLGLNARKADQLFRPFHVEDWTDITADHAIAVLECLIETGEVDWSATPLSATTESKP